MPTKYLSVFDYFVGLTLKVLCTFKVKKFELFFYKINACLQKTMFCVGLRVEQIFSVSIQYTYLSNLEVTLAVPFLCYFQKFQLLAVKEIWPCFCSIVLLYLWAQKMCLKFLKSYLRLEILMFLSFAVSFLVDMFN